MSIFVSIMVSSSFISSKPVIKPYSIPAYSKKNGVGTPLP